MEVQVGIVHATTSGKINPHPRMKAAALRPPSYLRPNLGNFFRDSALQNGVLTLMGTLLRVRCLCCGFKTLDLPDSLGLCPVCWWQDDGQDDSDADTVRGTVDGELSLTEARNNFQACGAAHPRFVSHVRKPLQAEG